MSIELTLFTQFLNKKFWELKGRAQELLFRYISELFISLLLLWILIKNLKKKIQSKLKFKLEIRKKLYKINLSNKGIGFKSLDCKLLT